MARTLKKHLPLLDLTPAFSAGPSKVTRAQIRKAVLAVVKARRARTRASAKK